MVLVNSASWIKAHEVDRRRERGRKTGRIRASFVMAQLTSCCLFTFYAVKVILTVVGAYDVFGLSYFIDGLLSQFSDETVSHTCEDQTKLVLV